MGKRPDRTGLPNTRHHHRQQQQQVLKMHTRLECLLYLFFFGLLIDYENGRHHHNHNTQLHPSMSNGAWDADASWAPGLFFHFLFIWLYPLWKTKSWTTVTSNKVTQLYSTTRGHHQKNLLLQPHPGGHGNMSILRYACHLWLALSEAAFVTVFFFFFTLTWFFTVKVAKLGLNYISHVTH